MAMYEDSARALNDQAKIYLSYPINHQPKRYFMRDDSVNHRNPALLPDEIIEQCLALVHAILETQNKGVKEPLTLILEERLLLLQSKRL